MNLACCSFPVKPSSLVSKLCRRPRGPRVLSKRWKAGCFDRCGILLHENFPRTLFGRKGPSQLPIGSETNPHLKGTETKTTANSKDILLSSSLKIVRCSYS